MSNLLTTIQILPPLAAGKNGFVVGLSPDSGNAVRTQLEHDLREPLGALGWQFRKTIRDVLDDAEAGDQIILCDDNVTRKSSHLPIHGMAGSAEADVVARSDSGAGHRAR